MSDIPPHVPAMLSALKFCGARREALRTLTDSEWRDLFSRWDTVRLMVPLRQICGNELPEWVRSQIDQNLLHNAERFERIKAVYLEFVNALPDTGAEHLVVKGFAQWPGFVEHPRFRSQSDIDVYCPPESINHAFETLFKIGYEPVRGIDFGKADHLPTMVRNRSWKWRGNYYDAEMPVAFDLHFCLWNESSTRLRPKGLDQFWLRRVERRLDNISFRALDSADNLGYFALHVLRDLLRGGVSVHNAYELARFLHLNADSEPFWKNWRELHDDSLRGLEAVSFRLAFEWFACRLSEEVAREINCLPGPVQSWFERCGHFPRRAWFRPNKVAAWLHLSLLQSSRDKRIALFKHLFPTTIPPVEASHIQATVQGGQKSVGPFRKRAQYVTYLASRAVYHARILPHTLWQGLRWWSATKNVSSGFWTFLGASFFFTFGMFIFFFLYNLYLIDRGFKENFIGLVTGAMAIGSITGTLPAGILAQRFGLRKTLLLCFALVALVSALRSLVASEPSLLVLAFLGGAVSSIWAVSISPVIAQLTSEKSRSFGFSMVFSSGIAIGFVGGLAGGFLPEWLAHITPLVTTVQAKQGALLIACAITALGLWPVSRLRFVPTPAPEKKVYARNPFLLRFLPAIAVWSLVTGAFIPFFNVYFSQHLRMPVKQVGMILSISQLSTVLAILVAPIVFQRFGLLTGIMYTQVATAVALGCLAVVPWGPSAALVYIVYVAFQWMSEPGMYSLLMNQVSPAERGGASALNFLVISLGQAVAAAVAGNAFVRFGYPVVLSVTAGVALVAAFLFRLLLGKPSLPVSQRLPTVVDP